MTNAAARLQKVSAEIMHLWEERTRNEVKAATHQERLALRDSLPEYLTQIVDALSTHIDRTPVRVKWDREESTRVGKKHGSERATDILYSMDQLIFEYHILRQTIIEVMERDEPLTPEDREIITCSVEQAVNDAATQYSDTLKDLQETVTNSLVHDLRTHVTTTKLSAQLILRRSENADHTVKLAGRILSSMDHLDLMIEDLLDASRLKVGEKLQFEVTECNLTVVAQEVAEESNFTGGNRVHVMNRAEAIGFWNERAIRRMLDNLVGNALKYGAADAPVLVKIEDQSENVIVSVYNQGTPIPQADQATLFQRFRRSSTSGTKRGWGLGLTVVHGIAEAHGGKITVKSEEGSGTTFTVELPKQGVRSEGVKPSLRTTLPLHSEHGIQKHQTLG